MDYKHILKKFSKYIIMFIIVLFSCVIITKSSIDINKALVISLIACTTFISLDQYAPSYTIINK